MTTKAQQVERTEAKTRLLTDPAALRPGDTVHCILRHCSKSGMLRVIQLMVFREGEPYQVGYNAALAMGATYDRQREGIRATGCGMDMGFHLVYELGEALWPDGYPCTGERCPSNDHSNGDLDYTPHLHKSGGYALRSRWL